eukprot:COSAG01_NODE_6704_length_3536_cov_7.500145_5_plen_82_part_00
MARAVQGGGDRPEVDEPTQGKHGEVGVVAHDGIRQLHATAAARASAGGGVGGHAVNRPGHRAHGSSSGHLRDIILRIRTLD